MGQNHRQRGLYTDIIAALAGLAAAKRSWRKKFWMLGLLLAFCATLLFGLGESLWILIAARLLQGISTPIINTTGLAIVADQVNPHEIGSSYAGHLLFLSRVQWLTNLRIGFVLSGMNLGLLASPFISGLVYERFGYFSVFAVVLSIIAVDLILRLLMIEQEEAAKWVPQESHGKPVEDSHKKFLSADGVCQVNVAEQNGQWLDAHEETPLLNSGTTKKQVSLIHRKFPLAIRIFSSKRLRAAFYGGFVHTLTITTLDTTLPLFVKNTFGWTSEAVGTLFFSVTVPSLLGPVIGWLSDRYGARKVTLFGFPLTVPSLSCMAFIRRNDLLEKVLVTVLLALLGAGLSFILLPLATDIFNEAMVIANEGGGNKDTAGTFAQSFAIFSIAMGLASVTGPSLSGLFYGRFGWPGVIGALTAMLAVGGLQVFRHTGERIPSGAAIDV